MKLSSLFRSRPKLHETGLSAVDWIASETKNPLDICLVGQLDTSSGKVAFIDPLAFMQKFEDCAVVCPTTGGKVIAFHDAQNARNSKLAIVFSDATVAGGDDVATCIVDAGMASIFTTLTYAAQLDFANSLGPDQNMYDDYFDRFDDPEGGERKMAKLPDGTPVPYVHSGWGDGGYPVFTLTDAQGNLCAVYTDFMGKNEAGEFLLPPAFVPPKS